jgi:phosphoethanolamine N-methyltransferase
MQFLKFLACACLPLLSFAQEQEYLEALVREAASQGYNEEFIELVEMIYGEGFLSQGGTDAVEHMVQGYALDNLKILDIGSGLGGPALYLAECYLADITGLEPQQFLHARAVRSAYGKELKGSLQFVLMEHPGNLSQFEDAAFDLIISKETFLHIPLPCKQAFFAEMHRVLKPGGVLIIMDWMSSGTLSKNTQKMMEMDGVAYHLLTEDSYHKLLEQSGFVSICVEDVTSETVQSCEENMEKIRTLSSIIQEKYGQDVYDYCLESWGYQRDAFAARELTAFILRSKN